MKPYQERIIAEKVELDAKLTKLGDFILSAAWRELVLAEKDRLIRQRETMKDYSNILAERIAAFE